MNNMKCGIPMDTYRSMEGLSKHQLDAFAVAPAYYKWSLTQQFTPSRTMVLGTLAHSHILENNVEYVLGPMVDRRTKAGKEEWENFVANNPNKTIVNQDELASLIGAHASATKLLNELTGNTSDLEAEVSMFWERSGVRCKGRADLFGEIDGEPYIIDLKTTSGIRYWDSKFFSLRYHVQAEWYSYGMRQITGSSVKFGFLVVDFEEPYMTQFVEMDEILMKRTFLSVEKEVESFARCQQFDEWPGLAKRRIISSK